jgi:hypothetical protein
MWLADIYNPIKMINTMNLLWAFDFKPEVDPDSGKPFPVDIFNFLDVGTCSYRSSKAVT